MVVLWSLWQQCIVCIIIWLCPFYPSHTHHTQGLPGSWRSIRVEYSLQLYWRCSWFHWPPAVYWQPHLPEPHCQGKCLGVLKWFLHSLAVHKLFNQTYILCHQGLTLYYKYATVICISLMNWFVIRGWLLVPPTNLFCSSLPAVVPWHIAWLVNFVRDFFFTFFAIQEPFTKFKVTKFLVPTSADQWIMIQSGITSNYLAVLTPIKPASKYASILGNCYISTDEWTR